MSLRWTVPIATVALAALCLFILDGTSDSEAVEPIPPTQEGDLWYQMDEEGNLEFWGNGIIHYDDGWSGCTTVTVRDGPVEFAPGAFDNCTSLTTLSIGGNVGNIESDAFRDCTSLSTLSIGGNVGDIASYAFKDCTSLTTLSIGGNAAGIGDAAFDNCTSLTTVTINGDVGSIEEFGFIHCASLTTVFIGGNAGDIGQNAFRDCASLTTLSIGGNVGDIGKEAFKNCNLETFEVTGGIDSISDKAFEYAFTDSPLSIFTVHGNIGPIGAAAFESSSTELNVYGTLDLDNMASDAFQNNCLERVNVHCTQAQTLIGAKGTDAYGRIVQNNPVVGTLHHYSATYGWSDDGKACTVHIVCANSSEHDHDENPTVTSSVKIQPTETEMGTTEYSVSGTYDGFVYSSTKDVQDIPATGGSDGKKDNTVLYIVAGVAAAAVLIGGAAFLILRKR